MIVDNAASCVIAAVNTYQRRYAIQAAQEVLTWRLVAGQVVEDDERSDVQRKLAEAEGKLKEKVRSAYRHCVYLTRKRDQLEVVFTRFDDDKLTALSGNDVWGTLITANRAVGEDVDIVEKRRKRMALSEVFVALLLDSFDRHLTLKDVLSSFYKDPRFPLIPTLDEIRQVIYNLLQPAEHAGPGTGGWELVGSDGVPLHVEGPRQLAISSIQQQLRRAKAKELFFGDKAGESGSGTAIAAGSETGTTSVGDSSGIVTTAGTAGKRCLKSIAPRWVFSLQDLGLALVSSVILLVLISKVPANVAAICGVPVGGAGDWGISTLFAGAEMGAQAAALASNFGGAALAGGWQLGSAVRNAVKQGQALSKGKS